MQSPTPKLPVDSPSGSREPVPTPMQQLRQATRNVHDEIERLLPLSDPSLTRARYIDVLEAFHGFYAPLEPLCRRATQDPAHAALALATRAKVPLLVADLTALGLTPSQVLGLPRCRALPTVMSASHAIGVLYVLEGATLGGQITRRHVLSTLGLDAANGAAFFTGYGDRTREMWMRFADHVSGVAALDLAAAIAAAIETFATLQRWCLESLAPP